MNILIACGACLTILGLYVLSVLRLKNREFYSQLVHLQGHELGRMMFNIFIYVVLELISLIMMTYVLKKKLRIDTTRQLAFMLQRQWAMVHSKILMWFFYVVQTSLVHCGTSSTPSDLVTLFLVRFFNYHVTEQLYRCRFQLQVRVVARRQLTEPTTN